MDRGIGPLICALLGSALVFLTGCGVGGAAGLDAPPTTPSYAGTARIRLEQVLVRIERDLAAARAFLTALAASDEVLQGDPETCSEFLRAQSALHPEFVHLGATTPNGVLFCNSLRMRRSASVADRLYFSRALSKQEFSVGEYVIGRITPLPSMGLAAPVRASDGSFRGIVLAPIKLSYLESQFAEVDIPVTGEIVLLDSYGNILVRDPDAVDWLGRNISETELGRAMLTQREGEGEFAGADGQRRYYAFSSPQGSSSSLFAAVGIQPTP